MDTATRPAARTAFPLRLPDDIYNTLRAEAFARKTSVNGIITEVLTEYVNANRDNLTDMIGRAAIERFAVVLEKLAE